MNRQRKSVPGERALTRLLRLETLDYVGARARARVSVDTEGRATETGSFLLEPGCNEMEFVVRIRESATVRFWVEEQSSSSQAAAVTISATDSGGIVRLGSCALTYSLTSASQQLRACRPPKRPTGT